MHTLQTELIKYIAIQANNVSIGGVDALRLSIQLYQVSLTLDILHQANVYTLQFRSNYRIIKDMNLPAASFNTKKVLEEIRSCAKTENKKQSAVWSDEYFSLVDAFADASLVVIESVGFVVKENHFNVLLSKDEVQCYFVLDYETELELTSYHLATYPSHNIISGFDEIFHGRNLDIVSVVNHVLSHFKSVEYASDKSPASMPQQTNDTTARRSVPNPPASMPQQTNDTTARRSVPNPPAQGSKSSDSSTIRLYDAIVELLIVVNADRTSSNDVEVIELLKQARERFKS
jgi:hypothetical protein